MFCDCVKKFVFTTKPDSNFPYLCTFCIIFSILFIGPTLKLKRPVATEKHAELIEKLYSE